MPFTGRAGVGRGLGKGAMEDVTALNKKFRKELKSGTVALVLLGVLDKAGEPLYGYQIAREILADGQETEIMKQGALYPVLRSLEKGGLLSSRVQVSESGPPRRYYTITGSGRTVLAEWIVIWRRNRDFIDAVLEGEVHV